MIEMKVSDIIDRYCIMRMKARFDPSLQEEVDRYLVEIIDRITTVANEIYASSRSVGIGEGLYPLLESIVALAESNGRIWENESPIRKETLGDPCSVPVLELEEIGRRALIIRDHNKIRTDAKNVIDGIFGQVQEKKFEHASQ